MTPTLREFLDEISDFWTNMMTSAGRLAFATTARGLAALTATADSCVLFILRTRSNGVELHGVKTILL
jgi:hypothetical protein